MGLHPKLKVLGRQFNANTLIISIASILFETVANQGIKKLDEMNNMLISMRTSQESQARLVEENRRRIEKLQVHEQNQDDRLSTVESRVDSIEKHIR